MTPNNNMHRTPLTWELMAKPVHLLQEKRKKGNKDEVPFTFLKKLCLEVRAEGLASFGILVIIYKASHYN